MTPMNGLKPPYGYDVEALESETDPLFESTSGGGTPSSTNGPATSPTQFPELGDQTMYPSYDPGYPTVPETFSPAASPSPYATLAPNNDDDLYPFNHPPTFPDPWYFNYDTRPDALYGPGQMVVEPTSSGLKSLYRNNKWADVPVASDYYWKEFTDDGFGPWKGVLSNYMPSRNRCGRVGLQSPIDVRNNGLGLCEEHHEVRSAAGDYPLSNNDEVKKQILGNKLRFLYKRRPCAALEQAKCQNPNPPKADFPNGWGGYADAMHVDFKVPSEHLLNGVRYDAELQTYHLHKDRRRMPSEATLIQATQDGFNWYFDEALKAFDFEFRRDALFCETKKRKGRQLVQDFQKQVGLRGNRTNKTDYDTWGQYSLESDSPGFKERQEIMEREMQNFIWDPHSPMLELTIYFYRYEGSITEPPCGEWVSWFVTSVPMQISFQQLDKLKNILFNHVDQNCRRTSVHYGQSVARPIQDTADRPVYLCTKTDFGPDP